MSDPLPETGRAVKKIRAARANAYLRGFADASKAIAQYSTSADMANAAVKALRAGFMRELNEENANGE